MIGYALLRLHPRDHGLGRALGHAMLILIAAAALGYAVSILVFAIKARKYDKIRKISAADLKQRLEELTPERLVVIADVRSHNYYDPGMQRIKNSIRVVPEHRAH
jgi:hypothetical protein